MYADEARIIITNNSLRKTVRLERTTYASAYPKDEIFCKVRKLVNFAFKMWVKLTFQEKF